MKPSAKIRPAMAMAESETVTSPTLNPKKAARSEDNRSADSMPQGASASMPAIRIRITRAMPVASTPICASERRRRPMLA